MSNKPVSAKEIADLIDRIAAEGLFGAPPESQIAKQVIRNLRAIELGTAALES